MGLTQSSIISDNNIKQQSLIVENKPRHTTNNTEKTDKLEIKNEILDTLLEESEEEVDEVKPVEEEKPVEEVDEIKQIEKVDEVKQVEKVDEIKQVEEVEEVKQLEEVKQIGRQIEITPTEVFSSTDVIKKKNKNKNHKKNHKKNHTN